MLRFALPCALLTLLLAAVTGTAGAASTTGCTAFKFKSDGVPWSATQIRKSGTTCKSARSLIRSYARPRNCRLQAPCHIDRYVCRTTESHESSFVETCKRSGRLVRWHGSYSSS